ncbi:MAG: hydrogenase formation protein HypD [Desulfatiglandales bacterium]
MKYQEEYRNPELVKRLVQRIHRRTPGNVTFMEFCGGHTFAIMKHGLRQLLHPKVNMLSGPGCPVCVTSIAEIDKAIAFARLPTVILATFGDMLRVPGSRSSLQQARAEGSDVRVVYSALDALEMAGGNPEKFVILAGIGFETTAPTIAASVLEARSRGIRNYFVLSMHKLCPPVIKVLLDSGEIKLDGIVCPGHVSSIIGSRPYAFVAGDYGIASVITGFEPVDILVAVDMMLAQIERGRPCVEIAYRRGVEPEGNPGALAIMNRVFEASEADWRGIGPIPGSGLRLREPFREFDAESAFAVEVPPPVEPPGCICGDILRGVRKPFECRLFKKACTPDHPVGPCMVSSEGACAAYFLFGETDER